MANKGELQCRENGGNNRSNTADYTDIKSGSCGTHSATAGYDLCTGVGVVKGYGKK